MLNRSSIFVGVTALLLPLTTLVYAAEVPPIRVYAPQTTYQVDVGVRNGVEYAGLTALLEPLGPLVAHSHGNRYRLNFDGRENDFQQGRRQARTGDGARVTLAAQFVMVNDRGYVPVASIAKLLPHITGQRVEFHRSARRLFIGSPQFHGTARLRSAPSRLVLSFPSPVHPDVKVEKGRVRLRFRREPVVNAGPNDVAYRDSFVRGTRFREADGAAELTALVRGAATVSVSPDGRTVTIEPAHVTAVKSPAPVNAAKASSPATAATALAPLAPAASPPATPKAVAPQSTASKSTAPPPAASPAVGASSPSGEAKATGPPFVVLDAAHGGKDNGAVLSSGLEEKTVNLALARQLQKALQARGVPVALLRSADTDMTWDQRAVAANTSHALLYLALHSSANGHGIRIYTAMLTQDAAAVPAGKSSRQFVPWDRVQSAHLQPSLQAAAALALECRKQGFPVTISVAPVGPLNHITLAAVAVEVAPLGSDPAELASAAYQQRVAAALAQGIAALRSPAEKRP